MISERMKFLESRDCALMLVDIQKVMLDLCVEPENVRRNASALVEVARIFDIPVLFTTHNGEKLGGALPELAEKASRPRVLDKMDFNCFENAAIAEAVRDMGRQTVLLAGIESHVCIFHTGIGALLSGYRVHVAADAVSSRSAFNRDIGLGRLEAAGAVRSSTEMIVFELLKRAGTAEFRAALPLIKSF